MHLRVTKLERAPGKWRLRVEWKDEKGERQFRYETVRGTADNAERRRAELLLMPTADAVRGPNKPGAVSLNATSRQGASVRFADYAERWLRERTAMGLLRGQTGATYESLIRNHLTPTWGRLALSEVSREEVLQGLMKLNSAGRMGPRTLRHVHTRLTAILTEAVSAGLIAANPALKIKLPKAPRSAGKILNDEQRDRLLAKVRAHRLGSVVRFALFTGARRGEMAGLRWADFNADCTVVRIERSIADDGTACWEVETKTEAGRRSVTLPATLAAEMRTRRSRDEDEARTRGVGVEELPVFRSRTGEAFTPGRLTDVVSELLGECGLAGFTLHSLRHTHASALLRSRQNPRSVAERLGHSNPAMTLAVYAHVLPRDDAALAVAIEEQMKGRGDA